MIGLIGQAVSEKKTFENGGQMVGRTTDHGYPISSPCEPKMLDNRWTLYHGYPRKSSSVEPSLWPK